MSKVIGLDIGGTKTAGLLVDGTDKVLATATQPTPTVGPEQLQRSVETLVAQLLRQANLPVRQLATIGIGIPGRVDEDTGAIATAVNLNLAHFPLGETLSQVFDLPIVVENDVRAAAVGAYRHLFPSGPARSLAYLNLGTGVSAGVVLDGRLYRGRNGMAGEIGHVVVDPQGVRCRCGQVGCLETLIAGPALTARAAITLGDPALATPAALFLAAAAGETRAIGPVREIVERIVHTIQWLVFTYDIDRLVLGGGVTHSGATFLDPVLSALREMRKDSPLLQTMLPETMVQTLPSGFNAGLWGAIHLARAGNPGKPIDSNQEGEEAK